MKKSTFLKLLFSFSIWLFSMTDSPAQCPGNLPCVASNNPGVTMDVIVLQEPAVCGNQGQVRIVISNNSNSSVVFPCLFSICLDEPGENDILFTGLAATSGPFQVVSGIGTSHATIASQVTLSPQTGTTFVINIKGSCELMDLLASGSTDEFENNQISVFSCYAATFPPAPQSTCIEAHSESFNVVYNLIAVEECNSTQEVNLGIPFDMEYNMAVTGDYCVDGFQLTVDFPPNMDISQMTPHISAFSGFIGVSINGVTINNNTAIIDVGFPISLPPMQYCADNFSGTFSDLRLLLKNLVLRECDNPIPVTVSTNSCDNANGDPTCYDTNGNLIPQSSATCFLEVPLGDPNMSITAQLVKGGLDFCDGTAAIEYTFTNTATDPEDNAFDVNLNVTHWEWMTIHGVYVGGTYYSAGTQPSWVSINGTTVSFNFGNDGAGITGMDDLDDDDGHDELQIGESISVRVRISSGCPFTDDECTSHLERYAYRGSLTWKNQCKTNSESTSTGQYVRIEGGPGAFEPLPGPIVESEFDVTYCVADNWVCNGLDDPPFDLGPFSITFQSSFTLYPRTDYVMPFLNALTYTDINGDRVRIEKNPKSPADAPSFTFLTAPADPCFTLHFSIDCPPEGGLIPVLIEFEAMGSWEECPDCFKKMGCASTTVLVDCPCDPDLADCSGGCEYVATSSSTIERRTPPGGTNSGAAYMCDNVGIRINGTVAAGYNGPVYGCFGYFGGTPDFFDAPSAVVQVFVNNVYEGNATYLGSSSSIPLGGSTSLDMYPFVFNWNFPVNSTIEFRFATTVSQSAVNTLAPGVTPVAVFTSLGEQDPPDGIKKCGLLADYFDIYRIDSEFYHPYNTFKCNDEKIAIPFALRYIGGTGGDDFPGEYRPVNKFTYLKLDIANTDFEILGISINGGATIPGTPATGGGMEYLNIESILPAPNDKVGNPGVSQEFEIILKGNCKATGGTSVMVSGDIKENYYLPNSNLDSDCMTEEPFSETVSFGYQNGGLVTQAQNTPVTTSQRCIILETSTYATSYSSDAVWIQFEFDPSIIESITPVAPTIGTVTTTGSNPTIWTMTFPNSIEETPATQANFEVCFNDACDYQPLVLPYHVGKVCEPDDIPNPPVPHTDPDACFVASDQFVISFEESGLNMVLNQCNEPGKDPCEIIYYSVTLENLAGAGNTGDIHFGLDLPSGFIVESLEYSHPFAGSSSCSDNQCSGQNNIDNLISDLTSANGIDLGATGILPGNGSNVAVGELPGVQSGLPNQNRRVNFCVGVRPTCKADPETDDLVFFSNGRRPCGSLIEIENNQFQDVLDDWFVDFDADIMFQQEVKLDCNTGQGVLFLEIFWPADLDLPPGQSVYLTVSNLSNISVLSPILINVNTALNPQVVQIPFTFDPLLSCEDRGEITVTLETSAIIDCGGEICYFHTDITSASTAFELNNGWVYVYNLEISEDLCPEAGPTVGDITFTMQNISVPAGKEFTALYFCDENEDGIPDGPEFASVNGVFGSPGISTVTLTIDENEFWAACPSGKIVVQLKIDPSCCICVRGDLMAEICCDCPEFNFNYTFVGGNTYVFTVDPTDYISLLYCWHDPDGNDVFLSTTDNPFTINFDTYGYVPDEVCVRIESNYVEDCEDPEGGGGSRFLTDPPCSEKYCRPMKECYADLDFSCEVGPVSGGSAPITLTGSVMTNMSPYTITWVIDGVTVGFGSPFTTTLTAGPHEICMLVNGVYQDKKCFFKECKEIFIEDDCKSLELDAGYSYTAKGPNSSGGYTLVVTPNFTAPGAQHEWYLATSNEGCTIGTPLSVQYGAPLTLNLQACQFYILIHKVIYEDCEACFSRCIWICDGFTGPQGSVRSEFDCSTLKKYEWPQSRFSDGYPIKPTIPLNENKQIFISPNPADDYINISWNFDNAVDLTLFDLSGKAIIKREVEEGLQEMRLETNPYRPGIYFTKVISGDGDFIVKKFEIQH